MTAGRSIKRWVIACLVIIGGIGLCIGAGWLMARSEKDGRVDQLASGIPQNMFNAMAPPKLESPVERAVRQVVGVYVLRLDPRGYHTTASKGAGVTIGNDAVLTALHVISGLDDSELRLKVFCNGEFRDATVTNEDALTDTALVHAPGCKGEKLRFEPRPVTSDERLHVAGYSYDSNRGRPYWFHVTTAVVPDAAELDPAKSETDTLRNQLIKMKESGLRQHFALNSGFVRGNSGSPVFNDSGAIVGRVDINEWGQDMGFIMPTDNVIPVLRSWGLDP